MYCSEAYSLILGRQIVCCHVLRVLHKPQEVFPKNKTDIQLYRGGCGRLKNWLWILGKVLNLAVYGCGAGVNMKSPNIMDENNTDVDTYGEGRNNDIKFVPDNGNDYINDPENETMLLENSPLKYYFGSKVHSTLWVHDFRKIRRENDRNKEQNYVNYVKKPVVCDDFGNIEVAQQVKGPFENSDLVDGKDAGENFSSALKEAEASRLLMFFRNTANIALLM
uniref:Uncharacterized protein n=1 Tax=Glossina palpalis gambiensis TaxID=67801 RepID=A0A1B0B937_9MUSC